MPEAPASMLWRKRSCPGIDDAGFCAVIEPQMREAEVERHAARAFLFPAIGIGAGQRLDERRFAVIHVAGGADDVHVKKSAFTCAEYDSFACSRASQC